MNTNDKTVVIPKFHTDNNPIIGIVGYNCVDYFCGAFESMGIESVIIPNSIVGINDWSFYESSMKDVVIPDSVFVIGEGAFGDAGLKHVTFLGPAAEMLKTDIFYDNNNLQERTVLVLDEYLEDYQAIAESNLSVPVNAIYSPNMKPYVPEPPNPNANSKNDFDYIYDEEIRGIIIRGYLNTTDTDVVIPNIIDGEPVLEIAMCAFSSCYYKEGETGEMAILTSVDIPNTIKKIGAYAFFNNQLTSITIPGSVKFIGTDAFRKNNLSHLEFKGAVSEIYDGAFNENHLPESQAYIFMNTSNK